MIGKNTICLWYDGAALDAARFYADTFPDSAVGSIHRAPGDYPDGKQGDILTVEFTVMGIPCLGLNGGPLFKHNEAFSFQVATDDQAETDRLWNAIINNGGRESQCGWCKDKWGLSWQITPRALMAAIADPDRAAAKRDDADDQDRHRRHRGSPSRLNLADWVLTLGPTVRRCDQRGLAGAFFQSRKTSRSKPSG
jgi:predicted 3-demethylubiquinone-9 3-methyltransferase (glyoxalase superfamily)